MPGDPSTPRRRPARPAYSLLELVAAAALVSATLVPALELVRDGLDLSETTDRHQLLAGYAVSAVERSMAETAYTWATGTLTGDFASDGMPEIRYTTVLSDAAIDGGLPDYLMSISATTYYDANGDDALGADELNCTYRTKLGRFATYEAL